MLSDSVCKIYKYCSNKWSTHARCKSWTFSNLNEKPFKSYSVLSFFISRWSRAHTQRIIYIYISVSSSHWWHFPSHFNPILVTVSRGKEYTRHIGKNTQGNQWTIKKSNVLLFSWPPFLFDPSAHMDCCATKNKNQKYKMQNNNNKNHFYHIGTPRIQMSYLIIIKKNPNEFLQVFFSTVSVAVLFEVKKIYVIERDFKTGN